MKWSIQVFPVAQRVKSSPAMQETTVRFLDQEDPLEKGMAIHSSILACKIPWTEETGGVHGVAKSRIRLSNYYYYYSVPFSSVAQSCPTFRPHELQHARPPCLSPTPRVYPNSCPSSWWCHPAISSSVVPFYSATNPSQHQVSQLFTWGGQSIGVSASASVLPMNTQNWSPLGWTGWISLQFKGLSRVFSNTTIQKHQFFGAQLSSQSNSHIPYMTTGKTIALTGWTFVGKVMSLLLNMLSSLVITCLPRNKHLLISWLQSPSAVILEPPKNKVWHCFHCFSIYFPWSDGVSKCPFRTMPREKAQRLKTECKWYC